MTTPVRRQYLKLKRQYPDAILFFRMGDFYEAFDDDAQTIAKELNIVLTARESKGVKTPMAGVPHHAADSYIARLVKAGYKVAICEQVGQVSKKLMKREVVRVITPGTVIEPSLLEAKKNNYLVALFWGKTPGLAYIDITTGKFASTILQGDDVERLILDEVVRLSPAEILVSNEQPELMEILKPLQIPITELEGWMFEFDKATQTILEHFSVSTLDGFGLANKPFIIRAVGAVLQYLMQTQKNMLPQITDLSTYSTSEFMVLDNQTRRNLELTQTMRGQSHKGSLVDVLDKTVTAMGGRLLRTWIQQPLLNVELLNKRLDAVEAFYQSTATRTEIAIAMKKIADIERLTSRVMQGLASPRELVDLRRSLTNIPNVIECLRKTDQPRLLKLANQLNPCTPVLILLQQAIVDNPPSKLSKGDVIRLGYSAELDSILKGTKKARQWIADLERNERHRTGIKKLKVGFNKVFGYYIEVSKNQLRLVPLDYIRKQTLKDVERYFTPELKEYESLLLHAEERQAKLEGSLFLDVLEEAAEYHSDLYQTAQVLAHIDLYMALGHIAAIADYVRPCLSDDDVIDIKDGRHPVVEFMERESLYRPVVYPTSLGTFVPNDTYLSDKALIWVITAPNMGGKSTFLRQVALIVLMAQIGSFVPARMAKIGLVDRIFTRIGAQDEIHTGQSTFMVEMIETAVILSQCTSKSLIILDEIGRGTSTYDGLAIARAVIEYIHDNPNSQAKTLFATHYHELIELEKYLPHVKNYNVAVTQEGNDVIFLHKVVPGGVDNSYGIYVAQLAGIPKSVIERANEILSDLENSQTVQQQNKQIRQAFGSHQTSFFPTETHPVVEELKVLKIEELSPLEALNILFNLRKRAVEGQGLP